MIKSQRPLGLLFVTKDDTAEKIAFMYPHVIESPLESLDEETQLDTNSILTESNKLVDGQRISSSADDLERDAASTVEKSSNESINKGIGSNFFNTPTVLRSAHKSESQTKLTSPTFDNRDEENSKIRNNWRPQLFSIASNPTTSQEKESKRESPNKFKATPSANTSNSLRKLNNSSDQNDNSNRLDENDLSKRRDRKSRLPIKVIAGMLHSYDESTGGVPFEVKIDKMRYVCNPWHIRRSVQSVGIVFVLHASCCDQIVEIYQNLSRKLAIAIDTEQSRCGYLRNEMQIIQPFLDRAEDFGHELYDTSATSTLKDEYIPYASIEMHSSLARTLRQVYEDVFNYGIVDVFINDCIQVGFCVDPCHNPAAGLVPTPVGDVENITNILQPYHTLLFFDDCVPGPDSNPYVLRFFEYYDLRRSLSEISSFSQMPLQQVKAVARHYILWGCAKIVYPLCNTNIYSTMESNPTTKLACTTFRRLFGPDLGLGSILASFHPPVTLGQFLEEKSFYSTVKIRKQMIVFLLRNNYITQLHKFLFILPPDSKSERFHQPLTDVELNLLSNRIKTQIRQFKPVDDAIRNALLRISVDTITAGVAEANYFWFLSTFISMYPFLNGEYHVEAVMCHKQLDRSTITRILDLFADIVVVLVSQAHVIHKNAFEFPKKRYFV